MAARSPSSGIRISNPCAPAAVRTSTSAGSVPWTEPERPVVLLRTESLTVELPPGHSLHLSRWVEWIDQHFERVAR
jgi:hypothetical protein